jgi:hypothetical protein
MAEARLKAEIQFLTVWKSKKAELVIASALVIEFRKSLVNKSSVCRPALVISLPPLCRLCGNCHTPI